MQRNRAYYGIQFARPQLAQGDTTSARATDTTVDTTTVSRPRIAQRRATVHHQPATPRRRRHHRDSNPPLHRRPHPALRPLLLDMHTEVYASRAHQLVRLPGPLRRRT
ncbi:hypothetical protein [Streptomyces sp. McG3]|uniref:hypothetical protein n=1 Tax=Streptomyces sp. McG3 TaxID=2725483 RepID=UPI0020369F83|nr:hypothetical protein [Streptomyces sp. McG3]